MNELVRWALLTYGLIYLVTEATIFMLPRAVIASKSRFLAILIYCPACSGFWIGLVLGCVGVWPFEDALRTGFLESAIAACALGAIAAKLHVNPAFYAEASLRATYGTDYFEEDDPTEASEDE